MADQAAAAEEGGSQSPLVSVSFQRNTRRKEKYLEAEPKALGITQIGLSAFQIISLATFLAKDLTSMHVDIPFFISSLLVVIAGSVAIAAQNLHLPTLRACFGMQIVACGASVFNLILALVNFDIMPYYCWHYHDDNSTQNYGEACNSIESTQSHFMTEYAVIQLTLLAISITLVAYSCKVINCCVPAPKVPVITVQSPPVQQ